MNELTESQLNNPQVLIRSIIQRVATGPELSKDISEREAQLAVKAMLEGKIDYVQIAIFLIGLRMKRETDAEFKGILRGVMDATNTITADVDEVVDIADPYNGYNRSLPATPFVPVVLAELGIATVCHGLWTVSPKYGITHHQVLKAAGVNVNLNMATAAARLADQNIGWTYIDQKEFCPGLHQLVDLRTKIVKRTPITTVEVLTGPIRGQHKTHLITGYVHKPYARIYAMLARCSGFDSALLVRGVEGGVAPSLRQMGRCFYYHDGGKEQSIDIDPTQLGIESLVRAAPFPDDLRKVDVSATGIGMDVDNEQAAKAAADVGLRALKGESGVVYDGVVYAASLCLMHLKRFQTLTEAAKKVRGVLDSGRAYDRLLK